MVVLLLLHLVNWRLEAHAQRMLECMRCMSSGWQTVECDMGGRFRSRQRAGGRGERARAPQVCLPLQGGRPAVQLKCSWRWQRQTRQEGRGVTAPFDVGGRRW